MAHLQNWLDGKRLMLNSTNSNSADGNIAELEISHCNIQEHLLDRIFKLSCTTLQKGHK